MCSAHFLQSNLAHLSKVLAHLHSNRDSHFTLARAGANDSADAGTCGIARGKAALLRHIRGSLTGMRHYSCPEG